MQCTAKRKDKTQCRSGAISGSNVCRMHGGAAPQVKEAARLRLLAMVDPALAVLVKSMKAQGKQPQVALAAAKDVLDRAGLKPTTEIGGIDGEPIKTNITITLVKSPALISE